MNHLFEEKGMKGMVSIFSQYINEPLEPYDLVIPGNMRTRIARPAETAWKNNSSEEAQEIYSLHIAGYVEKCAKLIKKITKEYSSEEGNQFKELYIFLSETGLIVRKKASEGCFILNDGFYQKNVYGSDTPFTEKYKGFIKIKNVQDIILKILNSDYLTNYKEMPPEKMLDFLSKALKSRIFLT